MEATKWIIWHEENRLQRVNILSLQGGKVIFLIVFRPAGKVSLTHLSHVKNPAWPWEPALIWAFSWFQQETWRRPGPGSPPPPDLCRRSWARAAARWAWAHVVLCQRQRLFYLWLTGTALEETQLKKKKPSTKTAMERSLINWPPCYVCCVVLVVMQHHHLATGVDHIKEASQVY